jgi:hypothetical protein
MTTRHKPYTFDAREWSASGARSALLNAAAVMNETGIARYQDGAQLVRGRWQSVASRPALGTEIMESGRAARRLLSLRRKAADARDRSRRSDANALRDVGTPMAEEWVSMARESFHAATVYAAQAAVLASLILRGEEK